MAPKKKTIAQIKSECKKKGLVYDSKTKKCRKSKKTSPKKRSATIKNKPKMEEKLVIKAPKQTIAQIKAECKKKGLVYDTKTKTCRPSKKTSAKVPTKVIKKPSSSPKKNKNISKPLIQPKLKDGCEKQITKKYTERNSPPYKANECCGHIKVGNDGNDYISLPDKNMVCRWKKL